MEKDFHEQVVIQYQKNNGIRSTMLQRAGILLPIIVGFIGISTTIFDENINKISDEINFITILVYVSFALFTLSLCFCLYILLPRKLRNPITTKTMGKKQNGEFELNEHLYDEWTDLEEVHFYKYMTMQYLDCNSILESRNNKDAKSYIIAVALFVGGIFFQYVSTYFDA